MEAEDEQVNERVCPTRLIDDTPAEDDLLSFHGDIGPHQRVAQAVVEVIQSPIESGGKMIGLEGGWGAGKTTVINLLRKLLAGKDDTTVFTFDAWAHEGDPLRRTYLESLIRHFQSLKWVEQTDWDNTLEELAKRRRITSTRTVPKTTALGKWFSISVFLVPIGVPLLATALHQGVTIDPDRPIAWMFIIGLLLAMAPFIVLAGNWIRLRWKQHRKNDSREPTDKRSDDGTEVSDWAFLAGDAITEIKQDTTETPDPTSIEFEDIFCRLMQAALPEKSNRQVVMVLDNLDRVDSNNARSIWATLQTFLQHRGIDTKQWFRRLWIIVPYDPAGLERLWMHRNAVEKEKDACKAHVQRLRDRIVSDSFIDKSFQLRFEVPPPVLSNWKAYLSSLVEQALPEHSIEDRHTIYRVLNHCRAKDGEAPSPRELKLYVNQIGAIHRQWQHKFPIGHIAYYVILRRMDTNVRAGLFAQELPDASIEAFLPPNLRANLAGLAFNVKATLGEQLLLSDPIHDFLSKNDDEGLKELERLHQDGFWAVLEEIVASQLVDDDAGSIANAALCLETAEILKGQSRSEVSTVIRGIVRAATSVKRWSPFDDNVARGIAAACRLASNPLASQQIVVNLRHTVETPREKNEPQTVTDVLIRGVVYVCTEIRMLGHEDALSTPFTLPLDAEGWIEVCTQVAKHESSVWPMFKPQVEFEEISESLCTMVTGGEFTRDRLTVIQVTQAAPMSCDWDTLAQAFEQQIDARQNPNSNETNLLLSGLSLLRQFDCGEAEVASKRLVDGGHITHNLFAAQDNVECTARCLIAFLEQRPGFEEPQRVGRSNAGYNMLSNLLSTDNEALAKSILEILRNQSNYDLLYKVVDERDQYDPLIIRCLRLVADSDAPEAVFKSDIILARWVDLVEYLDEEAPNDERFQGLIGHLYERSSLAEKVQESGFQCENTGLYLAIAQATSSTSFLEWCRDGLQTLDAATWKTELDEEGDALELLLELMNAGTEIVLKQPFQDALIEHATGVLTGSTPPSGELVSRRSKLLGTLSEAARIVLRNRLRDAAMNQDGRCADGFFDLYGDEISDVTTLTKNDAVVSELFSPLVRERNVSGLCWLNSVFSNEPKLLDKYKDKAAAKDFRERIEGEPASEKDEAHDLIAELAKTLGIELTNIAAEEEEVQEADTLEEENNKENPEKE